MKWKWVLGIASAALGVPAIAFYLILSSYNYNNFKPQIVRAVKEATGRELTLEGDISLKIGLTPALVVKNVSFRNAPWGSQAEMAKINRFEMSVKLLPILSRQIVVKKLTLVEPEILLETSSSGKSNLRVRDCKARAPLRRERGSGLQSKSADGRFRSTADREGAHHLHRPYIEKGLWFDGGYAHCNLYRRKWESD